MKTKGARFSIYSFPSLLGIPIYTDDEAEVYDICKKRENEEKGVVEVRDNKLNKYYGYGSYEKYFIPKPKSFLNRLAEFIGI